MSQVTACPACGTAFRVKPEQLAASQGKARCGKCSHVFDASSRLSDAPSEPTQSSEMTKPAPSAKPVKQDKKKSRKAEPTFLAKRTAPRWLFLVLILLLLLTAAGQGTYHLRSSIAAKWPMLKPPLQTACSLLGCSISLPQQAELLAIDDSDLQEDTDKQGLIHLSATLVNHATFAQAYPLLELTLTDTYDKPVIRRAFKPSEYLPRQDTTQGIMPGEEVQIRLPLAVSEVQVAGYRLFVAY